MGSNGYTPEEALELLMKKVQARDETLAIQIQAAIDSGKDVLETDPAVDRRRKPRQYRRAVPFEVGEALKVAVDALQAYFVEQPMFVDQALENLAATSLGPPTPIPNLEQNYSVGGEAVGLEQDGIEKEVAIELHTETQIRRTGQEIMPLKRTPITQIDEQKRNIAHLRGLLDFS